MDTTRKCYYKAYDGRYKAIHALNQTWAAETPTPIVLHMLEKYNISKDSSILEIGCGEGRDSVAILNKNYCLTASDVSPEAIRYCKERFPKYASSFEIIDACKDTLDKQFDFIFATSVLHMLVEDADRKAFLRFFRMHLRKNGIALILTMGDGETEFSTDTDTAFDMQERTNNANGIPVLVPNTSCRTVSFLTLKNELECASLVLLESGITQSLPDFNSLMYVVVSI